MTNINGHILLELIILAVHDGLDCRVIITV